MLKLVKSVKSSFTLLETVISIFLLSIIIVGFSKTSFYDNFDEEYVLLHNIENSFNTSSYDSKFKKDIKKLEIMINDFELKELDVQEIKFENENLRVKKYEL